MKYFLTIFVLLVIGFPALPQENDSVRILSGRKAVEDAKQDSVYDLLKAEQFARTRDDETARHERENEILRSEKKLKEAELEFRDLSIVAVSVSLLIVALLAWILFSQRREILQANKNLQIKNEEISFQKNAIESQAEELLILNEELIDLNKSLEGRINERTKQIFHQNKKLAEYTFTNAHKLRAPVASILGLINLLHQVEPDEQKIILNYLKTCGEQLDSIIHAISVNLEDGITEAKALREYAEGKPVKFIDQ